MLQKLIWFKLNLTQTPMDIKNFLITILSGMAGTVVMTLFMYLYSYVSHRFTKVVHILGNMLVGESNYKSPSTNAYIVGTVAHFSVGILFSLAYFLLWNWGIFRNNLEDSVIVGIISGVAAVVVWKSFLTLHSSPPQFSEINYFLALFLAHIVFAVVSVNVFQLITDNPELWYELQDTAKLSR
jgi:ABC-type Fe3+-siderophore transport system permease subunit